MTGRVVVVGGGVIGLSCAYHLRRQGAEVTVLEGERVGAGASSGNAGWIIPVHSAPLPGPDVRREPFRWRPIPGRAASDPDVQKVVVVGPEVPPRASSDARRQAGLAALARFNAGAMEAYDDLAADGVEFEMHRSGVLFAFVDPAGAAHELELLAPMRAFGAHAPRAAARAPSPSDPSSRRCRTRCARGSWSSPNATWSPTRCCGGWPVVFGRRASTSSRGTA